MTAATAAEMIRTMGDSDPEASHYEADMILLQLIEDEIDHGLDVVKAFLALKRWYA